MSNYYNRQWRLPNNENKDKQSNYSLSFDGSSYIDFGNSLNFVTSNYSLSFWIKTTSTTNLVICEKGANDEIAIQTLTSGNIRWAGTNGSDTSGVNVSDNNWHHLVFVANGSSSFIYIDGSLNTTGGNKIQASSNTDDFYIGSRAGLYGFNGQLDGVAIYNYALSSSQVTTLYGSSSTGIGNPMSLSPKPVAYYPLGDQDVFNSSSYLVPNSSLKDFVFNFNSTNTFINVGSLNNFISNNVTISLWANYDTLPSGYDGNLLISAQGTSWDEGLGFVNNGSSGNMRFFIQDWNNNPSGNGGFVDSTTTITINKWFNFVGTWDGTTVKYYINGDLQGSSTYTGSITTTNNLIIGTSYNPIYGIDGKMSNVQIFNTALPATGSNSIETIYNNGSPLTSMTGFTSLQGWWKLDASATYDSSTTTWTIPDDSTNSNDGTSSGMTQANLVQSDLSFTSGYSPYALSFDGTNEKIQYANGTIDLGLSSTETWWIKYSNSSATSSSIASAPVFAGFHILYEKSTNKVYYRIDSTNLYYEWVIPSTYFTDNLWHHYSIVRDDSLPFSSYIKLYIDGNLFGNPNAVNATSKSTTNTKITDWGGASAYSGIVADLSNIAVWNISLSSTEITEIFNSGVPSNLNNFSGTKPYSWWQLGSNMSYNSNWTILDEGTGNNNGSASNISEDSIVDGVASYANGTSSGMGGDEVVGDAPYSTANSLSVNMDVLDRTDDTPA